MECWRSSTESGLWQLSLAEELPKGREWEPIMLRLNLAFAMALSAALAGCSEGTRKSEPLLKTGFAKVALTVADLAAIDHVTLTITGGAVPITKTMAKVDDTHYSAPNDAIPVGTYQYTADAYADPAGTELVLTGHTVVAIRPDQTALVAIVLRDPTRPVGETRRLPVIDGLSASSASLMTDAVAAVVATAHSPESHELAYLWTDRCEGGARGAFADSAAAATSWTAPSVPGVCQLSVSVGDAANMSSVTAYMAVVVTDAHAPPTVIAVVDTYPMVALGTTEAVIVSANPPAGLMVGITADLVATGADADGSPVTFAWTSTCGGTFSPGAASGTVRFHTDDPRAMCALSVVVADNSTPANTIRGTVVIEGGGADRCFGVICPPASDVCHIASTCDPTTGTCGPGSPVLCPAGETCSLSSTPPGQCVPYGYPTAPVPKAAKNLPLFFPGGVAFDSAESLYITRTLFGNQTFDGISLTAAGASDTVLSKYDPTTHNPVWAKAYGDANKQVSIGVAVTQDGTVVGLGNFLGTLDTVTNPQSYPIDFLMGVDSDNGNVRWTNMFDNGINGALLAIAANPAQNIVAVCGYSSQASSMVTPEPTYGGGSRDAVIAVFRSTGEKVWARELGGANAEMCSRLAVDAVGDVYAVGSYNGILDLGGPTDLPALAGSTVVNWTWVAKLSGADGRTLAAAAFGGQRETGAAFGNHAPAGIAVDPAGNVVIVGSFTGNMKFGNTAELNLTPVGANDAFIAKLDPAFAPLWAKRMGSRGFVGVAAVALTASNDVVVVGAHNGTTTGAAVISGPNDNSLPNAYLLRLDGTTGAVQFARSYGGDGEAQDASFLAIQGSSFAFGGTNTGTIDFGGGVSHTAKPESAQMSYLVFGTLQ
jgi:hypothetical protein